MLVYLAHAQANYASENDGYVNAMRVCDHEQTLYSFHFLQGRQRLPIHENLRGHRLGADPLRRAVGGGEDAGDVDQLR